MELISWCLAGVLGREFSSVKCKPLGGMGGVRSTTCNAVLRFNLCDGGNNGWTLAFLPTPGLALEEPQWELPRLPPVTCLLCAPHPSSHAIPGSSSVLSLW